MPGTKHYATCFCKTCGSSLPWRNQAGTVVIVSAGTLDNAPTDRPQRNIFWDSRAPWYTDCSELKKWPELPVRKKD